MLAFEELDRPDMESIKQDIEKSMQDETFARSIPERISYFDESNSSN